MNYGHLAAAIDFYGSRGYIYTPDAPWYVSREAYHATKPEGAEDIIVEWGDTPHKYMVASGEQSFLQMMLDGVDLKRHICVTPCYRVEKYNNWKFPYFMKAELINAHDVDEGHLVHMITEAAEFFRQFIEVRVIKTDALSYDIVTKDGRVELGSYGIRERAIGGKDYEWIYGTACAEPRLSQALLQTRRYRSDSAFNVPSRTGASRERT